MKELKEELKTSTVGALEEYVKKLVFGSTDINPYKLNLE